VASEHRPALTKVRVFMDFAGERLRANFKETAGAGILNGLAEPEPTFQRVQAIAS